MAEAQTLTAANYKSEVKPDWCPSCGDYAVLAALQRACALLQIAPKDIVAVSGIGCSSNLPGFFGGYGIHSLHGRALPVATGLKLANHDLEVIMTGGDGDGYGIGLGHFIHAMRRNLDVTYMVMNNQIYGLTTGQTSPTSTKGEKTKSTPLGNLETPINPLHLALVSGATFVARAFSGDVEGMSEIMKQALQHKGFALVDCLSPCVTYNKHNTYAWFKERTYKLAEKGHDASNFEEAFKKASDWEEKIGLGVFYKVSKPTYEDDEVALKDGPLLKQKIGISEETGRKFMEELM